MPRTPEALSWSPQSTEQISRLIQALPPVIDLLLPKHSLSASCVPSPSSSPQVFPYSPHLKKAFPQLCSPSSYFTIFNLPFTAKPLQGVISMHTHCFLHIHSLPGPFAILNTSLYRCALELLAHTSNLLRIGQLFLIPFSLTTGPIAARSFLLVKCL